MLIREKREGWLARAILCLTHTSLFILGIFLGLTVGLITAEATQAILAQGIDVRVHGIPEDMTIRGGVNLMPLTNEQAEQLEQGTPLFPRR